MKKPLVSICCLAYNHENYIRECLDGFLMQKCDFLFEVLIHDDASTDGTADIIKEYEALYPGIIKPIYQVENQYSKGIKPTFKYNFPRVNGKFIAMCEGDDYWTDPYKLQKQVDFLVSNPEYSMTCHNAKIIYQSMDKKSISFYNKSVSHDINMQTIVEKWVIPTASMVFRKEYVENLPEWVYKIYSADFTLALFLKHYGKIWYSHDLMSVYRVDYNGSSVTATVGKNIDFVYNQHIELLKYFNNETRNKYMDIIDTRISTIKKELIFNKLKKNSLIEAFFKMPGLFIFKFKNKLLNILFNS